MGSRNAGSACELGFISTWSISVPKTSSVSKSQNSPAGDSTITSAEGCRRQLVTASNENTTSDYELRSYSNQAVICFCSGQYLESLNMSANVLDLAGD